MRLIFKLLIFHCLLSTVWGIRQFWRGRYVKGGGLGDPSKIYNNEAHLRSGTNEEKWFIQQLDHFYPANLGKTWQQV